MKRIVFFLGLSLIAAFIGYAIIVLKTATKQERLIAELYKTSIGEKDYTNQTFEYILTDLWQSAQAANPSLASTNLHIDITNSDRLISESLGSAKIYPLYLVLGNIYSFNFYISSNKVQLSDKKKSVNIFEMSATWYRRKKNRVLRFLGH